MALNWFLPPPQGEPGFVRRLSKRLGPSWRSSPLRRIVQALSLSIFLLLLLYVCWPYTAQRGQIWPGWVPVSVDTTTGRVVVAAEQEGGDTPAVDTLVYPIDAAYNQQQALAKFRVDQVEANELRLVPESVPSREQIDRLAMSFGPWILYESDPGDWPSHYADDFGSKQFLPAKSFLAIDPLVSLSATLASRMWISTLVWAGVLLLVCLVIPRGFCGYLCPLGTLIDIFDWLVGRRVSWYQIPAGSRWTRVRYYVLLATLVSATLGVVVSGFVAAIPVLTRGLVFLARPLQTAAHRGWHQVPDMTAGQWLSISLFAAVFILSFFGKRFWCRCLCPTGAIFSLASLLRITQRGVADSCAGCGKCLDACSFDAIDSDFSTRIANCAFCQTCGGTCPVGAIQFGLRWQLQARSPARQCVAKPAMQRRGFLTTAIGLLVAAAGGVVSAAALPADRLQRGKLGGRPPVRPPGSVPEEQFLAMCVRCGQCVQACPNDVLQPSGFELGTEGLWTPQVAANWSGCEPSCSNCGQVCPTGAIRALPLPEKRVARMGLAVVDHQTCLPYAGQADCQLCADECTAAGYRAIEFVRVGTEVGPDGSPLATSGFLAPVVLAEQCVGCGLCQARCHGLNCAEKGLLLRSAIIVEAGEGNEDRLHRGSYIALREKEERRRQEEQRSLLDNGADNDSYLPEFVD